MRGLIPTPMSKNTHSAKDAIKAYLDKRAASDLQFADRYAKPGKSIDECMKYIMGEAYKLQKSSSVCMTDDEVFGLAVHYYDEDDIKINTFPGHSAAAVSSSAPAVSTPAPAVKLTAKDKAAAKDEALREYKRRVMAEQVEAEAKRRAAASAKKKAAPDAHLQTVLDFDAL